MAEAMAGGEELLLYACGGLKNEHALEVERRFVFATILYTTNCTSYVSGIVIG